MGHNGSFLKSGFFIIGAILFSIHAIAQNNTYILIRHAEKDITAEGATLMNANPPLNKLGLKRAKKLLKVLHSYAIDSIYSTDFDRTKSTVLPLSIKKVIPINIYNHKALPTFATQLLQLQNKTVLIVGHSNSTPLLVNLLIKQQFYKQLNETVYNKMYIVTIVNGIATVNIKNY